MRRSASCRSRSSGRASSGSGSTTTLIALDLGAEELVRANGLPALLAVDDGDAREGRLTARAAAEQNTAALRALVRHLRLELLEPAAPGAARQADRDPVPEHLAAFFAQPVGRLA